MCCRVINFLNIQTLQSDSFKLCSIVWFLSLFHVTLTHSLSFIFGIVGRWHFNWYSFHSFELKRKNTAIWIQFQCLNFFCSNQFSSKLFCYFSNLFTLRIASSGWMQLAMCDIKCGAIIKISKRIVFTFWHVLIVPSEMLWLGHCGTGRHRSLMI